MQKSYYAIIPANIRYDNDLKANAKLLYGEITALCNEKGYCWASNSYFAELYKVSKETVSRWISQLSERGYIKIEIIYKEGTNQIINRYIRIGQEPIDKKVNTPIDEKVKDNITVINTTSNTTLDIPYVEIINYLNNVANKNYRSSTPKNKALIKARWNDGFRLDEFKSVIDIKTTEWKNNPDMSKYLRPETLFGTKFEGYLNQQNKPSDDPYDNLF
ncbi:conserved phage C-terminal domain-containing protein [Oceanobacillus sp. FSL W7-1309]|uniref:conserved phage C-terminal domain-containing protein n=1 Tax=Oceanobacillus sp. FSL W7-1309 TaxID=2954539 RepID=UPI0030FB8EBA